MANIKTVVIGGGSGFIGTALSYTLRSKGYTVLIVSRKPGASRITWGGIQKEGLPQETHAVVNLAGQNILDPTRRWTPGFKQNVWASRVNTTRYLAELIEDAAIKPKVFVTSSGVGFYPPSMMQEYTEESPGGDFDFLSRLCKDWEGAAELKEGTGVRVVNIRTGVVLGRQGGMIKQLYAPFFIGLGGPIGSGRQYMPWIHIADIVGIITHAIENPKIEGVVNGVAPQIITNREFTQSFGKALFRPAFIPLPTFALNFMFSPERAKVMTEGQKVLPTKALATGYKFKYPDINSAAIEFSRLVYADDDY